MSKKETKRLAILRAGEYLFGEHRYDEITMEEVAKTAGVGKGTIYRYFSGKEALLHAILQACHDDLIASLREVASKTGDYGQIVLEACHQIAKSHERRRPMHHVMFSLSRRPSKDCEGRHAQFQKNCDELFGILRGLMERGQREGMLRDDIPGHALAGFLYNLVSGWSFGQARAKSHGVEFEMVLDLFQKGAKK